MAAVMKVFAGPPGTGKTYEAARAAVRVLRPDTKPEDMQKVHQQLVEQGLIVWVTFHPSYSYEDFVEGFRPVESESKAITYEVRQGPFLKACATASMPVGSSRFHVGQKLKGYTVEYVEPGGVVLQSNITRKNAVSGEGRQFVDFWTIRYFRSLGLGASAMRYSGQNAKERRDIGRLTKLPTTILNNASRYAAVYEYLEENPEPKPVVLVIDEINRADLSRVFGELITLLEFDKREGAAEERSVTLTYSGKPFSVPAELSIIGTMNTADKSLSTVDLALRRRFEFELFTPDPEQTPDDYGGVNVRELFKQMNRRLAALNGSENLIGHADYREDKLEELRLRQAYPDDVDGQLQAFAHTLRQKTVPFLVDLFRGDWTQVGFVAGPDLFETDDLSDLADALQAIGHSEAVGVVHAADWWDPAAKTWKAPQFRALWPPAVPTV